MIFYGFHKTTLIDFPGEVASLLFTFGCNFRCPYCHNPELILEQGRPEPIPWETIYDYLVKRKNVLGGVCISGGEPLLQAELPSVVQAIHNLGLKVKIDTNGSLPERLKMIQADFIALDIKTAFDKYHYAGYRGKDNIVNLVKASIDWVIQSGTPHEFRTTVVPYVVTHDDIKNIVTYLKGASKYVLSQYRSNITLNPDWQEVNPYPVDVLKEMKNIIDSADISCEIR